MNLELLKNYFSFLGQCQLTLDKAREKLNTKRTNCFTFFKMISIHSAPEIDKKLLKAFINSFSFSLELTEPCSINSKSNFKVLPSQNDKKIDQILEIGVDLFLKQYGTNEKMTFDELSMFLIQDHQLPQKVRDIDFSCKKSFFQLIIGQIQCLLDADSFRKAVGLQCKNLIDMFQSLTSTGEITQQSVRKIYLMYGQKISENILKNISKRFKLPCNYGAFRLLFTINKNIGKYRKEQKVFYSSIRKKKQTDNFEDDEDNGDRFMTPNVKKTAAIGFSSTKLTKGERLNLLQQSTVTVSQFEELNEDANRKNTMILGQIIILEQQYNEKKRKLLFKSDFDLELVYERRGKDFKDILNKCYGSCNFTSFVRFIVPQDFEHRYLAFIKYQKDNKLSAETNSDIDSLLTQYEIKQKRIENMWRILDKELVFRSFLTPSEDKIKRDEILKYYTERQTKLLFDRMDADKTGEIHYQNFN